MAYQERNNAIVDKSFYFGCDIVNFCKILKEQKTSKLQVNCLKAERVLEQTLENHNEELALKILRISWQ